MSAFVVPIEHIHYLVSAALTLAPPPLRPFTYYWNGERHQVNFDNADHVGAMLLAANMDSVNYRYTENEIEDFYTYRECEVEPLTTLAAISCFKYQACETPDWPEREAKAFCDSLTWTAIDRIPGYSGQLAWPMDERKIRYQRGRRLIG